MKAIIATVVSIASLFGCAGPTGDYGADSARIGVSRTSGNFSILSMGDPKVCINPEDKSACQIDAKVLSYTNSGQTCTVGLELPAYIFLGREPEYQTKPIKWNLKNKPGSQLAETLEIKRVALKTDQYICKVDADQWHMDTEHNWRLKGIKESKKYLVCFYDVYVGPKGSTKECDPVDPVVVIQD